MKAGADPSGGILSRSLSGGGGGEPSCRGAETTESEVSLEPEEVTSEEDVYVHLSGGGYDAGRERQIERVCVKRNVWKGLANTKYSREN